MDKMEYEKMKKFTQKLLQQVGESHCNNQAQNSQKKENDFSLKPLTAHQEYLKQRAMQKRREEMLKKEDDFPLKPLTAHQEYMKQQAMQKRREEMKMRSFDINYQSTLMEAFEEAVGIKH